MNTRLAFIFLINAVVMAGITSCGSMESNDQDSVDAASGGGGTDGSTPGANQVTLQTDDGVELIADLYTTGTTGNPGVILLHMIPPSNSKANFTTAFIEPLVARGFNVLNVNRRGAPGSGGVATDAYTGPNGKLDAKAAYDFLIAHQSATPSTAIAVVGASNGTTTTTDFSVFAAGVRSTDQPAALVFLSGGSYTENQNSMKDNLTALSNHPIYFAYPPGESAWNIGIQGFAPANWTFTQYSPGAHGTGLFASNPEVITDVINFIDGVL